MARGVIIKSDYSNLNTLQLLRKEDGDIVIRTYIRDPDDGKIEIATHQGGTRLQHSTEIIQHFNAIINLLSDGTEREDIVTIIE